MRKEIKVQEKKSMQIVDISAYFVYPPVSGGQARIFGFNTAMSKYAKIEQFSFTPVLMRKKSLVHNANYTEHVSNHLFYTKGVVLLKLLGIKNYDFIVPLIFKFIKPRRNLMEAIKKCDIVQVEHPWLLGWAAKHTQKPIVLVEHNIEYEMQKEFFKNHWLKKYAKSSLKRTEQEAVQRADLVFAMSNKDKSELSEMYKISLKKVFVVPNGVSLKEYAYDSDSAHDSKMARTKAREKLGLPKEKCVIIFIGSRHPPNDEAAKFIEEKLAPKLKDMIFVIIGSVRKKNKTGLINNVLCTGVIDDVIPYYAAADIAINPVITGGGSNLKMHSYLAAGLPAITTRLGARGLGLEESKKEKNLEKSQAAIISELTDFPKNINRLVNNKRLCKKLGEAGVKFARQYDWEVIAKEAEAVYYGLLSKR